MGTTTTTSFCSETEKDDLKRNVNRCIAAILTTVDACNLPPKEHGRIRREVLDAVNLLELRIRTGSV